MVRDLMSESLEDRFGAKVLSAPHPIEWLSDNGPCYTVRETCEFIRALGLLVCTTTTYSPESNGKEAFVKTFKRDYAYLNRGIREISERLVERELGPRSEREVLLARERVIEREQWTEIDRALRRRAGFDRIVSYEHLETRNEVARVRAAQEMDRVRHLEKLGLARRINERTWELSAAHEAELRRRQREHDIIKTRAHERQRSRANEREFEK
jgi:type IV secretory pathway VirD2 relaxase